MGSKVGAREGELHTTKKRATRNVRGRSKGRSLSAYLTPSGSFAAARNRYIVSQPGKSATRSTAPQALKPALQDCSALRKHLLPSVVGTGAIISCSFPSQRPPITPPLALRHGGCVTRTL